jgi:signal peptidase I
MTLSRPPTFSPSIDLIPANSSAALRKLATDRSGTSFFCAHIGSSMNPTMCELDLLEIETYGSRPVEPGDVILFLTPDEGLPVVHRVMVVTPNSIRTRGDNSSSDDPWLLSRDQISGRVVAAWRGKKRRSIAGGRVGWLHGRATHHLRTLDRGVSRRLHPFYQSRGLSGFLRRLLPSRFSPRVVLFPAKSERQVKVLIGNRVVGRYDSTRQRWIIRRPFRLFMDEKTLHFDS